MQPETRTNGDHIEICPVDDTFAAEVAGVDLSKPLEPAVFTQIEYASNARGVISSRGQSLEPEKLIELSRQSGDVECHARREYVLEGFPEIHVRSNNNKGDKTICSAYTGDMWRSELCFTKRLSRCSTQHKAIAGYALPQRRNLIWTSVSGTEVF